MTIWEIAFVRFIFKQLLRFISCHIARSIFILDILPYDMLTYIWYFSVLLSTDVDTECAKMCSDVIYLPIGVKSVHSNQVFNNALAKHGRLLGYLLQCTFLYCKLPLKLSDISLLRPSVRSRMSSVHCKGFGLQRQRGKPYIDGLVRDCSNASALAMELLQSCTKPSILRYWFSEICWPKAPTSHQRKHLSAPKWLVHIHKNVMT